MLEILASATLSAIALLLELYYEESLEESSALLIEWLQLSNNQFSSVLFQIIGLVTAVAFLAVGCIVYLVYNQEIGFLGASAGFLGAAFSGTLKPLLGHPRPFWKYTGVKGLVCAKDYGAPSGHALSAGAALLVLGRFWLQTERRYKTKLSLLVFAGLIVVLDRLYLGVHFYFQVVLGFALAQLITAVFMHKKVHVFLGVMKTTRAAALCVVGGMLALSVLSLICYLLVNPSWDVFWETNFSMVCTAAFTAINAVLRNGSEATLYSLCAGFSLGYHLCETNSTECFSKAKLGVSCALTTLLMLYLIVLDAALIMVLPNFWGLLLINVNKLFGGIVLGCWFPYVLVKYVDNGMTQKVEMIVLNKCK